MCPLCFHLVHFIIVNVTHINAITNSAADDSTTDVTSHVHAYTGRVESPSVRLTQRTSFHGADVKSDGNGWRFSIEVDNVHQDHISVPTTTF